YTAALAVLARLAHELGSADGSPGQVAQAAAAVRHVSAEPAIDEVAVPARSLAIVGAGPWGVTAREGALRLREGARMLAEGFGTAGLLRGGAVPLPAAEGRVVLEPAADPDGLTGAVGSAAEAERVPVAVLAAAAVAAAADSGRLPPLVAQIPMTVRLQLLAERFARLRRPNPDLAVVGAWDEPAPAPGGAARG